MFDQIAYEHGADLRRAAAVLRAPKPYGVSRAASRADRAAPRLRHRVAARVRLAVLHRPAAPVGCEA